jgi:glutaconate CoA-transferase, subunit B
MFAYWLQAGRIDIGFLSAAEIDRHANMNTTVIGDYDRPSVRLPGAGGAPEISSGCGEVIVVMRHRPRAFVDRLHFVTTMGHGRGDGDRSSLNLRGRGPTVVITDLGVLRPDPSSYELTLTAVHPGVSAEQARSATGWDLAVSEALDTTEPPSAEELDVLRRLEATKEIA